MLSFAGIRWRKWVKKWSDDKTWCEWKIEILDAWGLRLEIHAWYVLKWYGAFQDDDSKRVDPFYRFPNSSRIVVSWKNVQQQVVGCWRAHFWMSSGFVATVTPNSVTPAVQCHFWGKEEKLIANLDREYTLANTHVQMNRDAKNKPNKSCQKPQWTCQTGDSFHHSGFTDVGIIFEVMAQNLNWKLIAKTHEWHVKKKLFSPEKILSSVCDFPKNKESSFSWCEMRDNFFDLSNFYFHSLWVYFFKIYGWYCCRMGRQCRIFFGMLLKVLG